VLPHYGRGSYGEYRETKILSEQSHPSETLLDVMAIGLPVTGQ